MQDRIAIISEMAGIEPGKPVTEAQIEVLVHNILNDVLHFVHHVDSGKYDLKSAISRIDYLIKESYGIK